MSKCGLPELDSRAIVPQGSNLVASGPLSARGINPEKHPALHEKEIAEMTRLVKNNCQVWCVCACICVRARLCLQCQTGTRNLKRNMLTRADAGARCSAGGQSNRDQVTLNLEPQTGCSAGGKSNRDQVPVVPSDLHVSALQAPEVISMVCVCAYLLARAPTGSCAHVLHVYWCVLIRIF